MTFGFYGGIVKLSCGNVRLQLQFLRIMDSCGHPSELNPRQAAPEPSDVASTQRTSYHMNGVNRAARRSKSNSPTFRSARNVHLIHLFTAPAMDVAAPRWEEEEVHVLIRTYSSVFSHMYARGLVLDHGPDPHVMVGGAILTSPRGITSMGSVLVEEALVEEVDGEADVVGIVKS